MKCPICGSKLWERGSKYAQFVCNTLAFDDGTVDQDGDCIRIHYKSLKTRVKALEEAGNAMLPFVSFWSSSSALEATIAFEKAKESK